MALGNKKLIQEFAKVVASARAGHTDEIDPVSAMDARNKTVKPMTREEFLDELDTRFSMLAAAMPQIARDSMPVAGADNRGKDCTVQIKLPGNMILDDEGDLHAWPAPGRKSFQIIYDDIKKLEGFQTLVKMAQTADVSLSIQCLGQSDYYWNKRSPFSSWAGCVDSMSDLNGNTVAISNRVSEDFNRLKPYTHIVPTVQDLYIRFDVSEKFDATRYPLPTKKMG